MQNELQTEVVLCPNCKEEVPKTLYCLNCGYPLYKMDLDRSAPKEPKDVKVEAEIEPFSIEPLTKLVEEAVVIEPEELHITPVVEEVEKAEVKVEPEVIIEPAKEVEIVESVVPSMTEEAIETKVELETFEAIEEEVEPSEEEMEPSVEAPKEITIEEEAERPEEAEAVEAPEAMVESLEEKIVEEPVIESVEKPVIEIVTEPIIESIAEPVIESVVEPAPEFEPEPAIKDVMENLAKNISMKIRLVNLFQEGGVKAETFNRLFESYAARGELLMNNRNEMLERTRFDLDSMERALNEAKIGLDELKIRRAIGDASEDEYRAKSPGFEWDIRGYEGDIARKKAEIVYLENLTRVMSAEEINELKERGECGYSAIDGLVDNGTISAETAARTKVALEEALTYLRVSSQ
jgi:hypothetical protein